MARIDNEGLINPQAATVAGQADWIDKLNNMVGNAKSTVTEIKSLIELQKGGKGGQSGGDQGNGGQGVQSFLAIIRAAGYGDKPIGQIITELAPLTVNQLEGEIKKQVLKRLVGGG